MAFASQPCRACALHHRDCGPTGPCHPRRRAMPAGAALRETGPDLASLTRDAVLAVGGRLHDGEQRATHALAWLATYVEAVRQLCAYAERMHAAGRLGELEQLMVEI